MNGKLYLLMLPIFLLLAACQKEQIINEYIVPNKTIFTTIPANGWAASPGGKRYIATINMPELTDYVNDRHGVLVYLSFESRIYEQIPQVYNGISFSYVTRPGAIDIDVQSSDGIEAGMGNPPGAVSVKIVLIESE